MFSLKILFRLLFVITFSFLSSSCLDESYIENEFCFYDEHRTNLAETGYEICFHDEHRANLAEIEIEIENDMYNSIEYEYEDEYEDEDEDETCIDSEFKYNEGICYSSDMNTDDKYTEITEIECLCCEFECVEQDTMHFDYYDPCTLCDDALNIKDNSCSYSVKYSKRHCSKSSF